MNLWPTVQTVQAKTIALYPYAHYSPKIIKYLCSDRLLIEHGPCNPPFNLLIVFFQLILTGCLHSPQFQQFTPQFMALPCQFKRGK
ncbi:hypothetical protein GCK72_024909 [Caenorhabditis remanei]|uniref:Uncharacterized protein n=1 Tax=Caenorhabditis remanei TaxID=31234 RepID=A0A6A5G1A6_CAERE|nr:hypothetical protein GCK72_024909 [Caenorhabditis remanei]KAF1748442.1 hypothetical protein GCK72_024909 [Caenorhabditis remanei]